MKQRRILESDDESQDENKPPVDRPARKPEAVPPVHRPATAARKPEAVEDKRTVPPATAVSDDNSDHNMPELEPQVLNDFFCTNKC